MKVGPSLVLAEELKSPQVLARLAPAASLQALEWAFSQPPVYQAVALPME